MKKNLMMLALPLATYLAVLATHLAASEVLEAEDIEPLVSLMCYSQVAEEGGTLVESIPQRLVLEVREIEGITRMLVQPTSGAQDFERSEMASKKPSFDITALDNTLWRRVFWGVGADVEKEAVYFSVARPSTLDYVVFSEAGHVAHGSFTKHPREQGYVWLPTTPRVSAGNRVTPTKRFELNTFLKQIARTVDFAIFGTAPHRSLRLLDSSGQPIVSLEEVRVETFQETENP